MRYSKDLRERVVKFVQDGGQCQAAADRYGVSLRTVFNWLQRIEAMKPGPKGARKIDMARLEQHVAEHSDAYLAERAAEFGVTPQAIWYALRRMEVRKKNLAVL